MHGAKTSLKSVKREHLNHALYRDQQSVNAMVAHRNGVIASILGFLRLVEANFYEILYQDIIIWFQRLFVAGGQNQWFVILCI